jgi:hypothetical protein
MSVKTPHQPCIAPQIDHDLPPQNTPKSAKPPVKDHIDPVKFFSWHGRGSGAADTLRE